MSTVTMDELLKRLESAQPGEPLRLRTSPYFGEMTAILEINPAWPQKKQKKYLLWVGKTESIARSGKPFLQSDKAKNVVKWVAERSAQWIPEAQLPEKAA